MKIFSFITLLFCSGLAAAQECGEPEARHWSSVVKLEYAQVILNWTGVYEGTDTVCGISYKTNLGQPQSLEVYGQPLINKKQSLLGFVTCADDGCENEIHVADIARGLVLRADLPIDAHQIYLKAKWKGSSRQLIIDVESSFNGKDLPPSQFLCSVAESIRCTRVL